MEENIKRKMIINQNKLTHDDIMAVFLNDGTLIPPKEPYYSPRPIVSNVHFFTGDELIEQPTNLNYNDSEFGDCFVNEESDLDQGYDLLKDEEYWDMVEEEDRLHQEEEDAYKEGLNQIKSDYPYYNTDYAAFNREDLEDVRRQARTDDYLMNW